MRVKAVIYSFLMLTMLLVSACEGDVPEDIFEEGTHVMTNGNSEERNVKNESNEDSDLIIQIIFSCLNRLEETYHIRLFSNGKIISSFGTRDETDCEITNLDFALVYTEIEKERFLSEEQLRELINLIGLISVDDKVVELAVAGPIGKIDIIHIGNIFRYLYHHHVLSFPYNEDFYRYASMNEELLSMYREYLVSAPYDENIPRLTLSEFLSEFNAISCDSDIYISVHMRRIIDKFLEYSPIEIDSSRWVGGLLFGGYWDGMFMRDVIASLSGLAD